ncbi:mRNA decay activator protein ZFP36L1-like [Corythoichthys intestinalis]|uniref:mRNA decay activator protein ZFP36L1-like n=1 Tax=Corythoichthys intestinalis TaxID=161448 RepID=UPI0025A4E594|nr:mRNA decay activator protein ZFP36L1-like [Corythoichthys intestinalis]
MPSRILTPFLEVDRDFCKDFVVPDGNGGEARGLLSRIPFRSDRSVSMIEGGVPAEVPPPTPPRPPTSARYKTELCRAFRESGVCEYGAKCQFAHGPDELRGLSRHPKYKTEPCRTFHAAGFCPYGARCHFIHNAEEARAVLRHSLSFAGFDSRPSSSSLPLLWPGLLRPFSDEADCAFGLSAAPIPGRPVVLRRYFSADSLSASSYSLSSGAESPGREGEVDERRLPIFSRMSLSDG